MEQQLCKHFREHHQRLEKLNESIGIHRVIEEIPISILIMDTAGKTEYTNSAFTKLTGYTLGEITGLKPLFLLATQPPESFVENLRETFRNGKVWHGELVNKKKNGDCFVGSISIFPNRNRQGKITHYVSFCENITEKKRLAEELKAVREEAEKCEQLKSAFLANVSHEIRTPMSGIIGFTSLLKNPCLTGEEKDHYIEIIHRSSERMLQVINELMEISKIETGIVSVRHSEVKVNKLIDYFLHVYEPAARRKGIAITGRKALPDQEVVLNTDEGKLRGIFMHLINNALKYTHEGNIGVGYRMLANRIEFFVSDTGIGISGAHQQTIFERFIQVDMSLSSHYEGLGLGLTISKEYVKMLGGSLRLESEPCKGSVFFFDLPCQPVC